MSYQPPFTITSQILKRVSSISERLGEINSDLINNSPMLRKENRIKTIIGTLAIEGNTLTEEQVTAVLEGKNVLGSVKELAEVKGAIKAYEMLPELNPLAIDDLLKAHRFMMQDILHEAGSFRTKSVGIHKGAAVVHIAPQANRVAGLVADLFEWMQHCDHHPLIISTVFHYEFEFIHPFSDGNGRMGRLWQTLILSQWKTLFLSLPLESVIKRYQQQYYTALALADNQANCTVFIEFMLKTIDRTLSKNASVNALENAPVNIKSLKTTDAILAILKRDRLIPRKKIATMLDKDIRTIGRAIKKLQNSGKLKRIGSDKSGHWEVL